MNLNNQDLFATRALVNGKWIATQSKFKVTNPATNEQIAEVTSCGEVECNDAIAAAEAAFNKYRQVLAKDRASLLARIAKLMLDNQDDLALLMTTEQGKTLAEAKTEVIYAASFFEWFAAEARRIYGDVIATNQANSRIIVVKEPVGVVAAITPWNFPLAMFTRKAAAAIAAGCSVVWKPSEETPLSALALGKIMQLAGVPDGLVNIVCGNVAEISAALMKSSVVKKITFTGSTNVGKLLYRQSADTLKKLSLELGGNAPVIIYADANLDNAIAGVMSAKFRNCGQACISINRVYVHESLYNAFVAAITAKVKQLKVGNGNDKDTNIGPLINEGAVNKVERHVSDAVNLGAKIMCGGERLGGNFFAPTVLSDVTAKMLISHEETFGPILACFRFDSEEEVIKLANDTTAGLAAYFYTSNLDRLFTVSTQLQYGMIGVNCTMISNEQLPFGGIKESGFGREGSKYGLDDYLIVKAITITNS